MKLTNGYARILVISCALLVICILSYYLLSGSLFQPVHKGTLDTTTDVQAPAFPPIIDAEFEVQEANITIVRYINSTPVSFEDLQKYPELESYLHGVNTNPEVWHNGWRLVADFKGNLSRYDSLVRDVCKGKTIFECNRGTLIEYHDQFYQISYQQYGTLKRNPNW